MNAVVFVSPWPNVVYHENMEKEVLLASMTFIVLIEHWSLPSGQTHEFPEEEYHKDIEGCKPPISLQENSDWIRPILSLVLVDLFDRKETQSKACNPEKDVCLEISLQNEIKERHIYPLVNHLKVLEGS